MGNLASLRSFIREVYQLWVREKPNQLAAALAYFGMFSFAAVIYIAFRFAGIFINELAAGERLYTRIEAVLGTETAVFIQDSVAAISAANTGGSLIVSAISLISLLLAALGFFLELKDVLNRIWGVPLVQSAQKLALVRRYLFAFIMIIAFGLMIILATVVNVAFAWFGTIIKDVYRGSEILRALNVLALFGVIVLAHAFIYKVLPDIKLAWRDVWPGSLASSLLMGLGGLGIGLYFNLGGISSAFEAAGAYAVLMIAIYYFAQIFLFGALITRVYTQKYGSQRGSNQNNAGR